LITKEIFSEKTGLEIAQEIINKKIPKYPIQETVGYDLIKAEPGYSLFETDPSAYESLMNPIGVVHGGVSGVVMDSAMWCAVSTVVPKGAKIWTVNFTINLVRAITREIGVLQCEGKVIYCGRSVATAEAMMKDLSGKIYSHAQGSYMIVPGAKM